MRYLIFILSALVLPSCCIYQMPTNDHIATNPNVNNPQLTNEKPPSLPGR